LRARISNEAQTNKSWLDKFHFARTSPNDLRRRDETTPPVSLCLGSPTTLPHFPVQSTVHPTTQTLESRRRPTPPPDPATTAPPPRPQPHSAATTRSPRRRPPRAAGSTASYPATPTQSPASLIRAEGASGGRRRDRRARGRRPD
jgi:hypothetical protein